MRHIIADCWWSITAGYYGIVTVDYNVVSMAGCGCSTSAVPVSGGGTLVEAPPREDTIYYSGNKKIRSSITVISKSMMQFSCTQFNTIVNRKSKWIVHRNHQLTKLLLILVVMKLWWILISQAKHWNSALIQSVTPCLFAKVGTLLISVMWQ